MHSTILQQIHIQTPFYTPLHQYIFLHNYLHPHPMKFFFSIGSFDWSFQLPGDMVCQNLVLENKPILKLKQKLKEKKMLKNKT